MKIVNLNEEKIVKKTIKIVLEENFMRTQQLINKLKCSFPDAVICEIEKNQFSITISRLEHNIDDDIFKIQTDLITIYTIELEQDQRNKEKSKILDEIKSELNHMLTKGTDPNIGTLLCHLHNIEIDKDLKDEASLREVKKIEFITQNNEFFFKNSTQLNDLIKKLEFIIRK